MSEIAKYRHNTACIIFQKYILNSLTAFHKVSADMKSLEVSLSQKKADRGQLMVKNEILPRVFQPNGLF